MREAGLCASRPDGTALDHRTIDGGAKGLRSLKAYWQVSAHQSALQDHMQKAQIEDAVETIMKAA